MKKLFEISNPKISGIRDVYCLEKFTENATNPNIRIKCKKVFENIYMYLIFATWKFFKYFFFFFYFSLKEKCFDTEKHFNYSLFFFSSSISLTIFLSLKKISVLHFYYFDYFKFEKHLSQKGIIFLFIFHFNFCYLFAPRKFQ